MSPIDEGEIVKSKVLAIRDNMVVLDIGFKSEGTVPLEEFKDLPTSSQATKSRCCSSISRTRKAPSSCRRRKPTSCACGRRSAWRTRPTSRSRARWSRRSRAAWSSTSWASMRSSPASQIALRRVPNIDELLGQTYEFKIIKLNKRRRNIVVSRRVILENERAGKREKLMKELAEGSGAEGRGQEHHRLRRIHRSRRRRRPAPHHRHVVGPHLASVRAGAHRRRSSRSRFSTSIGSASASRSASSSSRAIRGRTSPRSIRSARACRARSSRSRTTARSSSSSRASKDSCTSAR